MVSAAAGHLSNFGTPCKKTMSNEVEIGVWVEGAQKWVTGVSRRTTCHDVIKALLRSQNLPATDSEVGNYVIVERWRKVERPLDHEQRILKVWKTWGEAIQEVRFTLRKVRSEGERLESEAESRTERSRRRHRWKASQGHHGKEGEKTSKRSSKEEPSISETMDRLMRLVLAQGETIQTQLRRLQERDHQIESYEQQMHLLRVKSLGSDYLLHSYLKDPTQDPNSATSLGQNASPKDDLTCEETSNDSGVVTEEICDPSETLEGVKSDGSPKRVDVTEEVEEVRMRVSALEDLESILANLIEQELFLSNLETSLIELQSTEVSQIKDELAHVSKVHSQTVTTVRQNDAHLRELDTILFHRKSSLESLCEEETKLDEEIMALESHLEFIMHLPPSAFTALPSNDSPHENKEDKKNNSNINNNQKPLVKSTETALNVKNSLKSSSELPTKVKQRLPTSREPSNPAPSDPDVPPPLPSSSPPPLENENEQTLVEMPLKSDSKTIKESKTKTNTISNSTSISTAPSSNPHNEILKTRTFSKKCIEPSKDNDSTDSNSDTGLSSLHSSSDEGVIYSLDTLV